MFHQLVALFHFEIPSLIKRFPPYAVVMTDRPAPTKVSAPDVVVVMVFTAEALPDISTTVTSNPAGTVLARGSVLVRAADMAVQMAVPVDPVFTKLASFTVDVVPVLCPMV